jgi:hypothetical protein
MTDEHLARPEWMPVRASGRPLPGRRLHQLAQHDYQPMTRSSKGGRGGRRLSIRKQSRSHRLSDQVFDTVNWQPDH